MPKNKQMDVAHSSFCSSGVRKTVDDFDLDLPFVYQWVAKRTSDVTWVRTRLWLRPPVVNRRVHRVWVCIRPCVLFVRLSLCFGAHHPSRKSVKHGHCGGERRGGFYSGAWREENGGQAERWQSGAMKRKWEHSRRFIAQTAEGSLLGGEWHGRGTLTATTRRVSVAHPVSGACCCQFLFSFESELAVKQ